MARQIIDLSMPVHGDMVVFPRVARPALLMYEVWEQLAEGIGAAEEGAKVVVAELDEAAGRETSALVSAAGGEALHVTTDIRREAQVESMVSRAAAAYGMVDILYNIAAIEIRGSATQLSEDDWDATMGTNVKGCWLCCKHAIPEMRKVGGGVIINSASTLSYRVADERAAGRGYGRPERLYRGLGQRQLPGLGPWRIGST